MEQAAESLLLAASRCDEGSVKRLLVPETAATSQAYHRSLLADRPELRG